MKNCLNYLFILLSNLIYLLTYTNLSYSNDKSLNNLCFCYEYRKYPRKNKYSYCEVFNIINKDEKYMYKFGVYSTSYKDVVQTVCEIESPVTE